MPADSIIKKIPPHSEDSERSILGAMLMRPEAIVMATEILSKDDFYERQYGIIFDTMKSMNDAGMPVDIVTVRAELQQKNLPEELSSLSFLTELISSVPTSAHAEQYANIVRQKAQMRRLIKTVADIENDCYLGELSNDEIMEKAEKNIFAVLQQRSAEDAKSIKEVVLETLDAIENASKSTSHVTGLETGFLDLDYKTSGFQRSDMILVAARPSMGKTAFVLNIAEHIAFHKHMPCAMFSLEMSSAQLMNRLLSLESRVDSQKIRTGNLNDEDWQKVVEAATVISQSGLVIDDTPGISLQEFRSKARKYKADHDIQIIFIDYLQLMTGSGKSGENRQQEISDISRGLKSLARELNIPIVALSQLNRSVETRDDHRPMLSDLRESGAIEQDADVVMFIYRDDYYHKDTDEKNVAEIIIAKQRNGPIGTTKLVWLPEYTKFANMKKGGASAAAQQ